MKQFVLLLTVIFLSVSCKKSGSDDASVQYEFTSDISSTYRIEYSSDVDMVNTESFQGTSWSKSVIAKRNPNFSNIALARLVVYPPSSWANTASKAHVNLKIVVNGAVKVNKDTLMTASNVDMGIFELLSF
jgi:hypothetical protein